MRTFGQMTDMVSTPPNGCQCPCHHFGDAPDTPPCFRCVTLKQCENDNKRMLQELGLW